MTNGSEGPPPPPPEEPGTIDSPAPADNPASADVSTATAADAQSPDAVTTLPQTPEDTLGQLQNALYQSYTDTGWSAATYHLLILTVNQYAVITGTFDPQFVFQTLYAFYFVITPSAGAIQVLDDRAQAVDAGLGILSSPSDTSTKQNVQTAGEPIDLF